jgi:hypothetical protein
MTTNETSDLDTVFARMACLTIASRGNYYDLMPTPSQTHSCGVRHASYAACGVREPLLRSDEDPHTSIRHLYDQGAKEPVRWPREVGCTVKR